jgi:hypothetical protein
MTNKECSSAQCKYYDICGRDAEGNPADGLCILHSTDATKDVQAFAEALATHRKRNGDNFVGFIFPGSANFAGTKFGEGANFHGATFTEEANFVNATFTKEATFSEVEFGKGADFARVTFGESIDFHGARFSGRTFFTGRQESAQASYIFAHTMVDFRQVLINPPDVIAFLRADLTRCQFLDTDLRKVQLIDIKWPRKGGRVIVYDEIARVDHIAGGTPPWLQLERLYRELKQNYEDRRDYERSGDFHYGEKEMRRKNPDTARDLRFFFTLYWLVSGYGERYLRPLVWAGLLFVGSTIGYMWWGVRPKAGGSSLTWTRGWDWLQGTYYSFRVMTHLNTDNWTPEGHAEVINAVQTLLSPLFLGIFALEAVRQRLKH